MNRENYLSVSGADYIRAMFANTKEDMSLTFEEEGKENTTCYMDWKEADMEEIVARFEKLLSALTRLGQEHDRWETSTEDMPEDLLAVWNTYIVPYPDHGMDENQLFDISMKKELGEPLTQEEKRMLEKKYAWLAKHAETRLPYVRRTPLFVIQRARRYEKLVALGAPAMVTQNEARYLAEELALYCARTK